MLVPADHALCEAERIDILLQSGDVRQIGDIATQRATTDRDLCGSIDKRRFGDRSNLTNGGERVQPVEAGVTNRGIGRAGSVDLSKIKN